MGKLSKNARTLIPDIKKMKKKGANLPSKMTFSERLLDWNQLKNDRKMPWKAEKDPYKIWLSEIILQQTRVDQGLKYYERFVDRFPTIHQLAQAPEALVFKLWEGLGYYSRCRNLLATARLVSGDGKGSFPNTYEQILALKGVGPYTAAAISSFAYNLPHAVVDGNVFRVLSRVFGIKTAIDSTEGKKEFNALAQQLLDKHKPALYNQAIMDFGATICKPANPSCNICPFQDTCVAYQQNLIALLPVKEKKTSVRKRWFYYFLLEYKGKIAIRQRTGKDIWQLLFEFPVMENEQEILMEDLLPRSEEEGLLPVKKYELISVSPVFRQQLSHQLIAGQFIRIRLGQKPALKQGDHWVSAEEMKTYAFPRFINHYLEQDSAQALF